MGKTTLQDKEEKFLICEKCGACACEGCWQEFYGKCRCCGHDKRKEGLPPKMKDKQN